MEKQLISRRKTTFFSPLSNQITDNQEDLLAYIQEPIRLEAFKDQIERKKKSYSAEQRNLIHKICTEQLQPFFHFGKVKSNVAALKEENTFTVTAGHQLNLYGGPLYSIYKIMDAVKMAEKVNAHYPSYHIVPVFWMATEDHDFEEINHIHLFHDTLTWETDQTGPVGRFSIDDMTTFKTELLSKFENNPEFSKFLSTTYQHGNLAEATREFLMKLVGKYGILILDADKAELKKSFTPLLEKELFEQFSAPKIEQQIEQLEKEGYHGQATPRPINLFYIKDQFRERIIPQDNGDFEIGSKTFTKAKIQEELAHHPERFSPNVVFRPLYQEFILPNLCYLGGGGEMAYWLELKGMFAETNIPFPLIKVRNSIQWIDKKTKKKLDKLGLDPLTVFSPIDSVKKHYVLDHSEDELDFTSLSENTAALIEELIASVITIDSGLEGYGKSEATKISNQIEKLKQKLLRHQKQKNDTAMQQIDGIYANLFPNNGLQERYENVIPFLTKMKSDEFVDCIYQSLDAFETKLIILIES